MGYQQVSPLAAVSGLTVRGWPPAAESDRATNTAHGTGSVSHSPLPPEAWLMLVLPSASVDELKLAGPFGAGSGLSLSQERNWYEKGR